ncbi:MAG: hypothetical protein HPY50_18320 [Firmicutes bacterium]|nr:hypothetical protein [Bacillota bacterium]
MKGIPGKKGLLRLTAMVSLLLLVPTAASSVPAPPGGFQTARTPAGVSASFSPPQPAALSSYPLNGTPSDPQVLARHYKASPRTVLPASIDWSYLMPPPGHQGDLGSCVAWSAVYALRSAVQQRDYQWGVKTSRHQFSPSYVYNQITGGRDTGASIAEVLDLLKYQGVDTLNDFPYNPTDDSRQPNWAQRQRAKLFKISDWRTIATAQNGTINIRAIKQGLRQGPVEVGTEVCEQPGWSTTGDISLAGGFKSVPQGQHAVCLVGYDDQRWTQDGPGAFKFINSWGPAWGHQGYGWLSYQYARKFIYEAVTIENNRNQSYDAAGNVKIKRLGAKGVTLKFKRLDRKGWAPATVTTDANGQWRQAGFQVGGYYQVTPYKPGFSFSPASVKVSVDDLNRASYNFQAVKQKG